MFIGFIGLGLFYLSFNLKVKHTSFGDGQNQIPLSAVPVVCVCVLQKDRDWACPVNHWALSA